MATGQPEGTAIGRRRGRILASMLRRVPGILPMKGWTVVTERLHPYIVDGSTDVIHRTRDGFEVHLDLEDYIQRGIFYDAWEAPELAFARTILRPGDTMFDVGANVGIFTLVASRAVMPGGQVHAFEPVPDNHERLAENVRLNHLDNVVLIRAAVGAAQGSMQLGLEAEMELTSGKRMSGFFTPGSGLRQVTVPVTSLDDYAQLHLPGGRVRLIKIDVEGYEPEVLRGMRALLAEQRVDAVMTEVSVYSLHRLGTTVRALVDEFTKPGYVLYRLGLPGILHRWTHRSEPTIPRRQAGKRSLLATLRIGIEDRERHFNLVAIRGAHPALAGTPRYLRIARLRQADG